MAASTTLAAIARRQEFQDRVYHFMVKAGEAIRAETPTTPGHAARTAWADTVADGSANVLSASASILNNATVATGAVDNPDATPDSFGISDTDLEFSLNESLHFLAGYDTGS